MSLELSKFLEAAFLSQKPELDIGLCSGEYGSSGVPGEGGWAFLMVEVAFVFETLEVFVVFAVHAVFGLRSHHYWWRLIYI
jgi:hypothetical protein